jgi:hypothetical protein
MRRRHVAAVEADLGAAGFGGDDLAVAVLGAGRPDRRLDDSVPSAPMSCWAVSRCVVGIVQSLVKRSLLYGAFRNSWVQ